MGGRIQVDVKVVSHKSGGASFPIHTANDEYSHYRILAVYLEQSTYSSDDFLKEAVRDFERLGIKVECMQTNKGFEFTNHFSNSQIHKQTLSETTAMALGIRHKFICPYTLRYSCSMTCILSIRWRDFGE